MPGKTNNRQLDVVAPGKETEKSHEFHRQHAARLMIAAL